MWLTAQQRQRQRGFGVQEGNIIKGIALYCNKVAMMQDGTFLSSQSEVYHPKVSEAGSVLPPSADQQLGYTNFECWLIPGKN